MSEELNKYEEQMDTEGLRVLRWSMFDSPDTPGSAYRFMEREPVVALDRAAQRYEYIPNVILGYTSKTVADKMGLVSVDSHRIGKAVRVRCVGYKKRLVLVRTLMEQGVQRFGIAKDFVYFDTDEMKPPAIYLWS
jgi:hypothetical protein